MSNAASSHSGKGDPLPLEFTIDALFDWDKYFAPNVSNPSEGSSEENSLTRLPTASTSRTSLPSSPGRDPDHAPHPSPPVFTVPQVEALKDVDSLLIPPLSKNQPPRPGNLAFGPNPTTPTSPSSSCLSPGMPPSGPPSPGGTPSRILKNPGQTATLRSLGACIPCRIGKVACDLKAPCASCIKACEKLNSSSAAETCMRQDPVSIIGRQRNRWNWTAPELSIPKPNHFRGSPIELLLSFSGGYGDCPTLPISVAGYYAADANGSTVSRRGISPDRPPLEQSMLKWSEEQRRFEVSADFSSQVDTMLRHFVERDLLYKVASGESPSAAKSTHVKNQKDLMEKLLKMRAMWKIWNARELFVRRPEAREVAYPIGTGLELESVQAHLKLCAGTALSRLEGEVLEGVSSYLSLGNARKTEPPALQQAMNISMWLSLMQLILLYRETENRVLVQPQRNALVIDIGASEARFKFNNTTKLLLDSLVVIYSGYFRTSKVLQGLNSPEPSAFNHDPELFAGFAQTWKNRQHFYDNIKTAIMPSDRLIRDHIVAKEEQVLSRKKTGRKA